MFGGSLGDGRNLKVRANTSPGCGGDVHDPSRPLAGTSVDMLGERPTAEIGSSGGGASKTGLIRVGACTRGCSHSAPSEPMGTEGFRSCRLKSRVFVCFPYEYVAVKCSNFECGWN